MRKLLILVAIILVILGAAVAVVPGFLDWNAYKDLVAEQIENQTGRKVTFGGNIGVTLIPAPAMVARDVRLSNAPGASLPDMVQLRSLELRIDPLPLLSGRLHFASARLIEPVISLERFADGRTNWQFDKPAKPTNVIPGIAQDTGPGGESPEPEDGDSMVRFNNVRIENGTVRYRDAGTGFSEEISGLNATFGAASLEGPLDGDGELIARGVAVRFEIAVGKTIQNRTVPFNLALNLPEGKSHLTVSGAVLGLPDKPRFKGSMKVEGQNLATLIKALDDSQILPGALHQDFALESELAVSATSAESQGIRLRLGDTRAKANVSATFTENVDFRSEIDIQRVNLDALLALPAVAGITAQADAARAIRQQDRQGTPSGESAPAKTGQPFALPADLHGTVETTIEALTYREGIVSQLKLNGEIAGGEIVVSQLSAQLPGGSDAAVFGIVSASDGKPRFEGELDLKVNDARRILRWLGVSPPEVAADRLRTLSLRVPKLTIESEQVQLAGVDAQMDGSRLTGGVTIAVRERPAFGAAFEIDRLNLDAYLPRSANGATNGAYVSPPSQSASEATPAPSGAAANGTETDIAQLIAGPLGFLGDFDCNLTFRAKQVFVRDTPIDDVRFDATLVQGALTIRDIAVGNMAGATISAKGGFDASSLIPEFKELDLTARTADPGLLFRYFQIETPRPLRDTKKLAASIRIDGSILNPSLAAHIQTPDSSLTADGGITLLPFSKVDLQTRFRHADLARFVRSFGADYRPATDLGGLDVSARFQSNGDGFTLDGMSGKIGPAKVAGDLIIALSGPRPKVSGKLRTGEIVVDHFLPPERTATLPRGMRRDSAIVPVAWISGTPTVPAATLAAAPGEAVSDRWSRTPLALSVLGTLDATLNIRADTLAYGPYRLTNPDIDLSLESGILKADRIEGRLFEGVLNGQFTLESIATPQIGATLSLTGGNLSEALADLAGSGGAAGRIDLEMTLSGLGRSEADIVASLLGEGRVSITGVDAGTNGAGTALAPVFGLLQNLNRIGGMLGSNAQGKGVADVTGTFRVENGVARSDDLKLASNLYEAAAKSVVNLAGWTISAEGHATPSQTILGEIAKTGIKVPDRFPFSVSGPLDSPDVQFRTPEGLKDFSIEIPRKLLEDKEARKQLLENLKKGLLGGR